MKTLILCLFFSLPIAAQQMHGEVKRLYIEVERHVFSNRTFMLANNEIPTYSLSMGLEIDVTKSIYTRQYINSIMGENQFRHVGYENEIGYKSPIGVDLYFRHFSGHSLDTSYQHPYPQDNVIGLRFNIIRK